MKSTQQTTPLNMIPDDRCFTAATNPDKSVEELWANWQKSRARRIETIQITPVQAPAHLPLSRFEWGLICVIAVSGTLCLGVILLAVLSTYGHSIKSMWASATALF